MATHSVDGYCCSVARCSTFVLFAPLFGSAAEYAGYKVGLIGILSLVFYMTTGEPLANDGPALEYVLFLMREGLIGFFLAFVFQGVVLALRVAGEMIGQEMGLTIAGQVDPVSGVNTPLITRLYESFFYIGLLMVDGHHALFRAMGETFERAPIGEASFHLPIGEFLGELFSQMFTAGLTFAAPVLVVLALVSVLTGLLARAVPQLNVLEVSFTLRVSLALIAMLVFAPMLAPAMESLYQGMADALDEALIVLEESHG